MVEVCLTSVFIPVPVLSAASNNSDFDRYTFFDNIAAK